MGFTVVFNWVLQMDPPAELKLKNTYDFQKSKNRAFPIDTPIDLIDLERNAIAKIKVKSFSNDKTGTTGVFKVLKIYSDTERETLTNYWIENQ